MQDDPQIWQARAAMCELLALAFRYPNEELVSIVMSGEWTDAASEISGALGIEWEANDDALLSSDAEGEFHEMRQEATRLFIGAPEAAVSPYEFFWRSEDDGIRPLLLVNPYSTEVERFCNECGLGKSDDIANESLDSVWTELELLEILAARAAAGDADAAAKYDSFLEEHALAWMPRFADAVKRKATLEFYAQAADLLDRFLAR